MELHRAERTQEAQYAGSSVDTLHDGLSELLAQFEECLAHVNMAGDLRSLKGQIDEYRAGSEASPDYLHAYGLDLLEKLLSSLREAESALQRFDEESQGAKHLSGRKADCLSRAAAAALRAKERLEAEHQPSTQKEKDHAAHHQEP